LWSISGKRTFPWKIVVEPLSVLAVIINHVVLPHPFEQPYLCRCECAKSVLVPPIARASCTANLWVPFPYTSIDLVISEWSYEGTLCPINLILSTSCCPGTIPQSTFQTHWLPHRKWNTLVRMVSVNSYRNRIHHKTEKQKLIFKLTWHTNWLNRLNIDRTRWLTQSGLYSTTLNKYESSLLDQTTDEFSPLACLFHQRKHLFVEYMAARRHCQETQSLPHLALVDQR